MYYWYDFFQLGYIMMAAPSHIYRSQSIIIIPTTAWSNHLMVDDGLVMCVRYCVCLREGLQRLPRTCQVEMVVFWCWYFFNACNMHGGVIAESATPRLWCFGLCGYGAARWHAQDVVDLMMWGFDDVVMWLMWGAFLCVRITRSPA